jgi:hypothetical protein
LALVGFLIYAAARPTAARAGSDITTPLLISAGVAGGVAVIMLIAILASDKDDPDFLDAFAPMKPVPPAVAQPRTLRYGPECGNAPGGPALLCW